jgi:hypothetical protein
MTPQAGNTVVIIFRNNIQIDGEVVSWSDNKAVLKSLSGSSFIVIQKPLEDILFYKISNAKNEYEKIKEKPIKEKEDLQALAKLKSDLNELERIEMKEKLNNHEIGEIKAVSYGIPRISKIKSSEHPPRTEISRESFCIGSGLSNLFSKKH